MGPYAVVDYNLTLSRLHSRLQTLLPRATLCQSRLYPLVRDLGFGLWFMSVDPDPLICTNPCEVDSK
jgi:hypothetical protein